MSSYLGQFTDQSADRIVDALDEAGIAWTAKSSGRFGRLLFAGDWGVRLFVVSPDDEERAWAIAERLAPDGVARRPPG